MRFLFTTLQLEESDFYGRVGVELRGRGHDVSHVVFSRRSAARLRRAGMRSYCLPELMSGLDGQAGLATAAGRIERDYETHSLRDVYRTDPICRGRPERWCVERTVRHFLALERVFDEVRPEVVVPEVGNETMRTAAHLIGLRRGATVFFLFHTIFPSGLRLYANTARAPIVPADSLRELSEPERAEVEHFIATFKLRDRPITPYRSLRITLPRLRRHLRDAALRTLYERENEYVWPRGSVERNLGEMTSAVLARRFYEPLDETRPFVYFPLHVTNDYKVKRAIPHCIDQASLIEQVAEALPQGYDLVLKEHPLSIGGNSVSLLRRITRPPNVRLVAPRTSSHELIRRARASVVISSTVGLEALLYARPVLTLGQPFYSGYGVTVDVDSFREIRDKVPEVLRFRPDREGILRLLHAAMRICYPGAPVGIDASEGNAVTLAVSLEAAAFAQASSERAHTGVA